MPWDCRRAGRTSKGTRVVVQGSLAQSMQQVLERKSVHLFYGLISGDPQNPLIIKSKDQSVDLVTGCDRNSSG